jgi:hypothetical protein
MRRIFLVVACWFGFWISIGIMLGLLSKGLDGLFSGAMNGAWIATLTSFAWPWIMPESLSQWMDGVDQQMDRERRSASESPDRS